jgi:NNP family nitrate/nitrite transporter-like MFS transporter
VESLALFVCAFVAIFVLSGLGNGSTYKMIPAIFRAKAALAVAAGDDADTADRSARRSSRALIGIAGAVGGLGGVAVNLVLRQSFLSNGSGDAAYAAFIAFFLVCLAVTWVVYRRPSSSRLVGV